MKHNYKVNGIEFINNNDQLLVKISQCGVSATYPLNENIQQNKIKYVLMDLDGTTVKSEEFWVYLIEKTVQACLKKDDFHLEKSDAPYVSGFTTVEHLEYCKNRYHFSQSISEALEEYHRIARFELNEIMLGRGNINAFEPRKGLKEFLLELKRMNIKIGVATSGLKYKAVPEIVSTFKLIGLGDPLEFYDGLITGGDQKEGEYGTIGEIASKPHPWIYRELALGLKVDDMSNAIVLEDSSAGIISAKLAGINVIGFKDGNLFESGLDEQCLLMVDSFKEVLDYIKRLNKN